MNKPIINGIDVSECYYYESKNDTGEWCDLTCTKDNAPVFRCEKIPNCHFKQLKRLQKENEELKEERNQAVNEFNALMTDIMIDISFTGIKNTGISIKSHLHKMQKALKALEEIREILNKECGVISNAKVVGIINEVLNDRD